MAFAVLVDVEPPPCELIAEDWAEGIPDDDGTRPPVRSRFVLRGGDDPSADNDLDTVEDSPKGCSVLPVGRSFDGCERLDDGSNAGLTLRAA